MRCELSSKQLGESVGEKVVVVDVRPACTEEPIESIFESKTLPKVRSQRALSQLPSELPRIWRSFTHSPMLLIREDPCRIRRIGMADIRYFNLGFLEVQAHRTRTSPQLSSQLNQNQVTSVRAFLLRKAYVRKDI